MVRSIVQRLTEMHIQERISLEESLYESLSKEEIVEKNKDFQVGDIIFSRYYSSRSSTIVSKHPIMIITRVERGDIYTQYEGLPLKSDNKNKSNKYEGGYPNSISIDNYSSILEPGDPDAQYPPSKASFIDVQDLARFRSSDIEDYRYAYVGHATDEFYQFAIDAHTRYKSGGDNSQIHWER